MTIFRVPGCLVISGLPPGSMPPEAHLSAVIALFGYVVYEDSADRPKEPVTPLERASMLLSQFSGKPRTNYLLAAFVIALVVPLLTVPPEKLLSAL